MEGKHFKEKFGRLTITIQRYLLMFLLPISNKLFNCFNIFREMLKIIKMLKLQGNLGHGGATGLPKNSRGVMGLPKISRGAMGLPKYFGQSHWGCAKN